MRKIIIAVIIMFIITPPAYLMAQKSSDTAVTKIGSPKGGDSGWPTTGTVTQGPRGTTSHARIQAVGGGPALDIANVIGTPIYSPFSGAVRAFDCSRGACDNTYGSLGNYVKLVPESNPSAIVLFGHMSSVTVADNSRIEAGEQIGLMGDTGADPGAYHLHYEFRGIPMAPPHIPEEIAPENCDSTPCKPQTVSSTGVGSSTSIANSDQYWFLLLRQSRVEYLYKGTPGDTSNSELIKEFKVRPGKPGERPTPLPSLAGKEFWNITSKESRGGAVGPYFLVLDIPFVNESGGPTPYNECGGQCNWGAGDFGLHGTGGDPSKVENDGSLDQNWSSGCIRHFDEDITYLYDTLPSGNNIRYYVENR